jgi:hypothetical protein
MLLVFALTLFTSATLLFLVQPIIGKMITPLLGGTPAVWNTCMVFFQAILLVGYAYAHASTAWLGVRRQAAFHLAILLTPFLFFPLAVNPDLIRGGLDNPIPQLLLLLVTSVGVPFFVLSTSAPLLQKWFSSTDHPAARDPYFLYGASNLGSMLALLGYPTLVEPYLWLRQQTWSWAVGYGLLVLLVGACAVMMWLSAPARPEPQPEADEEPEIAPAAPANVDGIQAAGARVGVAAGRPALCKSTGEAPRADKLPVELTGEVTWLRRLRWVALAAVPSSLMLGATTYMTTDIAAIPLLWVLPLAVYLLTFIIVFSKVPRVVHTIFVLLLPLTLLLLLFMTLSDLRPTKIAYTLALHLLTLFVAAMVCHGELARDRPATKHLTEFFLWMSFGGVVGGMFNALVAPVVFNGVVEYQLAMVAACLLLPPLGLTGDSRYAFYTDFALAAVCLTVGSALIAMRLWVGDLSFSTPTNTAYAWYAVALVLMAALGVFGMWRLRGASSRDSAADRLLPLGVVFGVLALNVFGLGLVALLARAYAGTVGGVALLPLLLISAVVNGGAIFLLYWLRGGDERLPARIDLLLPFALLLLSVGLIWGLDTKPILRQVRGMSESVGLESFQLRSFVMFGIPAMICYTAIERSVRFGLCVAAVLLAVGFTTEFDSTVVTQERSFFGVLRVESDGASLSLVHGTTLHGRQFFTGPQAGQPMTYFHRTGPIGHVLYAYNPDTKDGEPKPNIGIIGLGTGTLACYAQPGQHMTFYDIDPVVRKLAYDPGAYFTYVDLARQRGAKMDLVMGDAKLTLERQHPTEDEKYDIFIVDAFSSDAIPVHLITYQAVQLYLDRMRPDGVLCFHISNRYLDLKPVLANIADQYTRDHKKQGDELVGYYMNDTEDEVGKAGSTWVVLCRSADKLRALKLADNWEGRLGMKQIAPDDTKSPKEWEQVQPALRALGVQAYCLEPRWYPLEVLPEIGVWTDDYASLLRVFSW